MNMRTRFIFALCYKPRIILVSGFATSVTVMSLEKPDAHQSSTEKFSQMSDIKVKLEPQTVREGTNAPTIFLSEQIRKCRSTFEEAVKQVAKLDQVLSHYYVAGQQDANRVEPTNATKINTSSSVSKCPNCNFLIVLKNTAKRFSLSCMGSPQCKFCLMLPSSVEDVQLGAQCTNCISPTMVLKLKFKPDSPFKAEQVGCLGCDEDLLRALNLHSLHSRTNVNTRTTTQVQPVSTTNNSGPVAGPSTQTNPSFDGVVWCYCGKPARKLVVKKHNRNHGRLFCNCGANKCKFFKWDVKRAKKRNKGKRKCSQSSNKTKVKQPNQN
uniref:GRF-type domain-containing protein n=1 Tax=Strigamia maritima TaxID=126957 RepID=T1J782_STRMM